MPNKADVLWFKTEFGAALKRAVEGTPLTVDLLTAIACQETGYLWQVMRRTLATDQVLALCVGDVIDASGGRDAFPRTKAALLEKPRGAEMFQIARKALEGIAEYNSSYAKAAKEPNKFCRGYGIFQYDLQFFLEDPDYFLEKR